MNAVPKINLLSSPRKRAIKTIFEDGPFLRTGGCWKNNKNQIVYHQTVAALYERGLVTIVVESRYRRRHTVLLTEAGDCIARDLIRQRDEARANAAFNSDITEKSARFIETVMA